MGEWIVPSGYSERTRKRGCEVLEIMIRPFVGVIHQQTHLTAVCGTFILAYQGVATWMQSKQKFKKPGRMEAKKLLVNNTNNGRKDRV
jgi:hypothetical protein